MARDHDNDIDHSEDSEASAHSMILPTDSGRPGTYHRIFSFMDQEDWPFLRHVLQMIFFHDSLYGRWTDIKLSASIILSSYSLRMLRDSIAGSGHFYSMESLRDICGCIVTFQEDNDLGGNTASLAHYTVREFLESDRVMLGAGAYFSLDPEETVKEIARLVFTHALAARFEETPRPTSEPDSYILAQTSLDMYCLFSASAVLYDMEELVGDDDKLVELAFRLLDPTSSRSFERNATMRRTTIPDDGMFRDAAGRGQRFWDIEWSQMPAYGEGGTLAVLLWSSFFRLAEKFTPNIEPNLLKDAKFELHATAFQHRTKSLTKLEFQGNILELFTISLPLLRDGGRAAIFILVHFPASFDPRPVLVAAAAFHHHQGQCDSDCYLFQTLGLVERARYPNWGTRVTPLQVAVYNGDLRVVEAFLNAGMNPNETGEEGGLRWDSNTILGQHCNVLHGSTSLLISRRAYGFYGDQGTQIERLLLEHGAREN